MSSSRLQARGNELTAQLTVCFEFPVRFTADALNPGNPDLLTVLRRREPFRRHRVLFVIDSGLLAAQPGLAENSLAYLRAHKGSLTPAAAPLVVEGGERLKNRAGSVDWLRARFAAAGLDRQSHVVVAGGGAVLDAVGFAAATLRRGLRVTRLPSTVLAQADACVALKNGVNAFGRKNAVGAFAAPFAVVCDARLLDTLPERERSSGMAEAFKVALASDASFFHWICENAGRLAAWDRKAVDPLVRWSARLHLDHVVKAGDPFEQDGGRSLDLGHWAARKLETLTEHKLSHGQAVSIGLAVDLLLSRELCGLDDAVVEPGLAALERLGLPIWHEALDAYEDGRRAVLRGLDELRDHTGGELSVRLLAEVGNTVELDAIDEHAAVRALDSLKRRTKRRR